MQQLNVATFGGNPASLERDANGYWFVGFNDRSRGNFYRVVKIARDGTRKDVPLEAEFGQANLRLLDDGLWIVGPIGNGDNRPIGWHRINEYVMPVIQGAIRKQTAAMLDLWRGRDYIAADFDTADEVALRVNKLRKALIDVVDSLFSK